MARIPRFKNLQEEREFWATHDFADYVDDTTDVTRPKDRNATRQKSWTVNVYLTNEEGIALAELSRIMGESKSTILRQGLHKLMSAEHSTSGISPATVLASYLDGINLEALASQISYVGLFLATENPSRDVDLSRKLKSVIQMALPGSQIEVMLKRMRAAEKDVSSPLTQGIDVKGRLTKREVAQVIAAVKTIAERTVGQQLRSRHPITEALPHATNE